MDGAAAPILEAVAIAKRYGERLVLDDVSFAVHPGEVVGLLGPNGAGKTTTLSILATLLRPDAGRILIAGKPAHTQPRPLRRMLGLVPQSLALYPTLSAAQNVRHFARMQGLSGRDAATACARALTEVGLSEWANAPMHTFSGGMKRRLNLACGLVHRPPVLLLDEPTVGVDPQSREQILTEIQRSAHRGSAVIYCTHYMEEAERICDRVLLIDRGRVLADGAVDRVIALAGGRPRVDITYRGRLPDARFGSLPMVREIGVIGREGSATLEMDNLVQIVDVLRGLHALHVNVVDFSLHSPNLSDAFIALTGRTLRDSAP